MKKFIALLLALLLMAGVAVAEHEAEPGFDTPEEAIGCYLEGLKNLNIDQMLSAFAWETQAEHFDMEYQLRRLGYYNSTTIPRLVGNEDFIISANAYAIRSRQINSVYCAIEGYLSNYMIDDPPATGTDEEWDSFVGMFDLNRLNDLANMSGITFLPPDEVTGGMFSNERTQENYKKQTAVYGAEEVRDIPATAKVGNGTIFTAPTVAQYGGKWYIVSLSSFTTTLCGLYANNCAFVWAEGSLTDLLNGLK